MRILLAILRSDSAFALAIIVPTMIGVAMIGVIEFNVIGLLVRH